VHYEVPSQRWETTRVGLVQKVWGQGFANPGGREHILNMVKIFGLDPTMTVLDLGAGLGGAARIMCEKFGVRVTGLEADAVLAEAAMALSVKAGMGEKVPINVFDPKAFELKARSVDCVFSKEFLFTVADKPKFLKAVERLLKLKGQFLFTDFVLAKPHLKSPALKEWMAHEPLKPYPWAIEDYHDALTGLHLDIRVTEDLTEIFRAMVIKGWADYTQSTQRGSIGEEAAPALVDEVELWSRRIQAIDCGDLKVCRVHVFKKEMGGMMSDW
jgi:ubiquinone/menaquinone biosynthesis C-methylase UbiE